MAYLDSILREIAHLSRRISALEKINQSATLQFGNIILDGANDKITIGGNNFVIDGANKRMIINDNSNNRVLIGYQNDGFGTGKDWGLKISREGYDVLTASDSDLIISSKFTIARENNIGFGRWNYTNVTSWEALNDCSCQIDFDDWPDSSVYLEITGKVGGGTAYYRVYNVTDGSAITGSETSTTSTTTTVFRSGAWTKPSGSKQIRLEYKVSDPSYYTDIYTARVVMRYSE